MLEELVDVFLSNPVPSDSKIKLKSTRSCAVVLGNNPVILMKVFIILGAALI